MHVAPYYKPLHWIYCIFISTWVITEQTKVDMYFDMELMENEISVSPI